MTDPFVHSQRRVKVHADGLSVEMGSDQASLVWRCSAWFASVSRGPHNEWSHRKTLKLRDATMNCILVLRRRRDMLAVL